MSPSEDYRTHQHVGSANTLSTYLRLVNDRASGSPMWLFRGQRNAQWLLKPTIARHKLVGATTEKEMLQEFRERAVPHLESTIELRDTDWLAIAQHHSMPTRLLDWSGSALAALWFAVHQPADERIGRARVPPAAVWMLPYSTDDLITDDEREDPLSVRRTSLFKPRHVSRRIAAQDGWFSLHRGNMKNGALDFISLDTNVDYRDDLRYVTIPQKAFGRMRAELRTAGVSRGVLFPDLEGIASGITAKYLFPDDEFPVRLGGLL